ncbi:hypothetical protein PSPO01_01102 [Paraphaeosphaeria sporulosa]
MTSVTRFTTRQSRPRKHASYGVTSAWAGSRCDDGPQRSGACVHCCLIRSKLSDGVDPSDPRCSRGIMRVHNLRASRFGSSMIGLLILKKSSLNRSQPGSMYHDRRFTRLGQHFQARRRSDSAAWMQLELGAGQIPASSCAGWLVVVGLGATQSAFCFKRVRSGARRV